MNPETTSERGRDLTLLALAIVLAVEAAFLAADVLAQGSHVLVRGAGRFALMAGLAYMTWQGFFMARWVLVLLIAAPVIAAPWIIGPILSDGAAGSVVLHTAGAAGYLVAGLLLAVYPDVASFLRHRRDLRERDAL